MTRVLELSPETAAAFERMGATNMRFGLLETELEAPPLEELQNALTLEVEPLTDAEALTLARRALPHKAAIDAITENAKMLIAEEQRALDAILAEDELRLRDWIRAKKADAKSKRTLFGTFCTRASGGNLQVIDEALALQSAREFNPEAIREVVDLKKLPKDFTAPGFDVTPTANKLSFMPLPRGKDGSDE